MAAMTNDWEPIDAVEFNAETDYVYTKPKVNGQGGKGVGILNANTKKSLDLSTPLMLTWGINEYVRDDGARTYDMSLQFPKEEYDSPEVAKFLENMKAFEAKLKLDAIKNSKDWMNKAKLTPEVCDALWTPMLKYPKYPEGHENAGEFDYTRPPTLRLKVPVWDGVFNIEIYDTGSQPLFPNDKGVVPTELIPKQINVATVIRCGGLYFIGGKFGVTWKLHQAVVKPKVSMKGKCLVKLSASDRAALEVVGDETTVGVTMADDTDDEEEDVVEETVVAVAEPESEPEPDPEPEPEPEPEPVAPVKKKVVRKKAVGTAGA